MLSIQNNNEKLCDRLFPEKRSKRHLDLTTLLYSNSVNLACVFNNYK